MLSCPDLSCLRSNYKNYHAPSLLLREFGIWVRALLRLILGAARVLGRWRAALWAKGACCATTTRHKTSIKPTRGRETRKRGTRGRCRLVLEPSGMKQSRYRIPYLFREEKINIWLNIWFFLSENNSQPSSFVQPRNSYIFMVVENHFSRVPKL